jgi:hypothetical protein
LEPSLARVVTEYVRRGDNSDDEDYSLQRKGFVAKKGGPGVFAFMFAKTLGCAALVGLSVPKVVRHIQKLGVYKAWTTNEYASILLANVSYLLPLIF